MKFKLIMVLVLSTAALKLSQEDPPGRDKGDNHDNSLIEKHESAKSTEVSEK